MHPGDCSSKKTPVADTPAAESDHRTARRLGLHCDDPEVLFLGIEQGAAACVERGEFRVGNAPEKFHVRRRLRLEPSAQRAVSRDAEPSVEAAERIDEQVLALVGHEPRDREVKIVGPPWVGRESTGGHGREDPLRGPRVVFFDPLGDGARRRQETIDLLRAAVSQVESPQCRDQGRGGDLEGPGPQVVVRLVPDVAHRSQAVADVKRPGVVGHRLCNGVTHRDDEVVTLEPEAANRKGKERQPGPVVVADPGDPRERTRVDR